MINVYKSPISKEKYANLFLDKIPESAKNVCLLFIGHSETVHYIMSQKPEIDFTVIDGSDVTEALPYIYTADNLKERITFEESDCEDETFLKKLETCFENYIMNNMSFNLVISNPPYGKSSSLSKRIVNKMLECKVAKEMVVLAPPSSFEVFYMKSFRDCGTTEDWFDTTAGSGVRIALTKLSIEKVDKYKSLEDVLLSDKQKQLLKTLRVYNATHKACFRGDYPIIKKSNYSKFSSIEENRIFLVPIQTAQQANCQVLRYGECFPHNFNNEPIVWKEKGAGVGSFVFDTFEQKKNFAKWWYTYSKESNRMGMLRSALYKISYTLNGDAGSRVLAELTPNLGWSHPWTDAEILKELGLPEDFLEKE